MNIKAELKHPTILFNLDSHPEHFVSLGDECTFSVDQLPQNTSYQAYLKFQNIRYTNPIQEWTSNSKFKFRPAAIGDYTILVKCKGDDTVNQWLEIDFQVRGKNIQADHQPTFVEKRDNVDWWTSSSWEAAFFLHHEKQILEKLVKIIEPGWVVYDIGANIGFHAMQFSQKTGNKGKVYCFEPNPLMIYFMHVNFSKNQLKNIEIIPLAITDVKKKIDFRINPGNSLIGLGDDSLQFSSKTGIEIGVQGMGLDDLINTYNLRIPNLIKIDIEGAESQALMGMKKTLHDHHPILLLEVHGKSPAINCFALLDELKYRYIDANTNRHYHNKTILLEEYGNGVALYYCIPQSYNLI